MVLIQFGITVWSGWRIQKQTMNQLWNIPNMDSLHILLWIKLKGSARDEEKERLWVRTKVRQNTRREKLWTKPYLFSIQCLCIISFFYVIYKPSQAMPIFKNSFQIYVRMQSIYVKCNKITWFYCCLSSCCAIVVII